MGEIAILLGAGCTKRFNIKLNRSSDVNRLLVEIGSLPSPEVPSVVADWLENAVQEGGLCQERGGGSGDVEKSLISGDSKRRKQGMWHASVRVGKIGLEPLPVWGALGVKKFAEPLS